MVMGTVKRKVCVESSRGACWTRSIVPLCCVVEKCTELRNSCNGLSPLLFLLSKDSIIFVCLSPSRFTALNLRRPVALTFRDVLDLSNHLHRQEGCTFLGYASYLANRTWAYPVFYNIPTKHHN